MATLPAQFPWGLGADATTASTATLESETFRLAQYIRGKPNMEAVLDAHGLSAEALAEAFTQLDTDRLTDNAFGAQLDLLGEIVGQPREGLSDDEYRPRLQAKILLNRCSGTVEEILTIFELIAPDGTVLKLEEYFPASLALVLYGVVLTDTEAVSFSKILNKARAAGVGSRLQWSAQLPAATFTFDGTVAQGFDNGHLAGEIE